MNGACRCLPRKQLQAPQNNHVNVGLGSGYAERIGTHTSLYGRICRAHCAAEGIEKGSIVLTFVWPSNYKVQTLIPEVLRHEDIYSERSLSTWVE